MTSYALTANHWGTIGAMFALAKSTNGTTDSVNNGSFQIDACPDGAPLFVALIYGTAATFRIVAPLDETVSDAEPWSAHVDPDDYRPTAAWSKIVGERRGNVVLTPGKTDAHLAFVENNSFSTREGEQTTWKMALRAEPATQHADRLDEALNAGPEPITQWAWPPHHLRIVNGLDRIGVKPPSWEAKPTGRTALVRTDSNLVIETALWP